ncbi:hypothetical protein FPQ18DRAFT_306011 [Pyronema domesticum]|nr:hypothetical protein FPQ18DRAFT_306011 [Pyronema domesticum]
MFVGFQQEADSQAALCQPLDHDDDVVSIASSGAPANAPEDIVVVADPAPSLFPPLETGNGHRRIRRSAVKFDYASDVGSGGEDNDDEPAGRSLFGSPYAPSVVDVGEPLQIIEVEIEEVQESTEEVVIESEEVRG